ncbi:hypothetical protein [Maribacter sp. 2-571]|uniref:hypothetical protein n=1 Tax=Maribacter sp. 2-571 TaxID=3417569 RepID=UPI003D32ED4F
MARSPLILCIFTLLLTSSCQWFSQKDGKHLPLHSPETEEQKMDFKDLRQQHDSLKRPDKLQKRRKRRDTLKPQSA